MRALEPEAEPPRPGLRTRPDRRVEDGVRDPRGDGLPVDRFEGPADFLLKGIGSLEEGPEFLDLLAAIRTLIEMFGHGCSPRLVHFAGGVRQQLGSVLPASVHDGSPNCGLSHFLRFWTALKWRDFAVPVEIRRASEISLN